MATGADIPLNAAAGTFSYSWRDDALTGLAYEIWTSTNLAQWTRDNNALQSPAIPVDEVETVAVTLSPALRSAPKLFIQVRSAPQLPCLQRAAWCRRRFEADGLLGFARI